MQRRIQVKRGQILQSTGDKNTKIFVVESGLLRSYTIGNNGKEHIFMFAPETWIIADVCSPEEPAQLMIDAIEESIVQVHIKDPDITIANKQMLRKRFFVMQNRIINLISTTAIERYDNFLDTYPNIVQRVPQRMVASFLGITPEALSKAKSDRIKKRSDQQNS
ncbi:MAG: Crp/Fnr family transcriptional regulator [Bacteroidota bacterium]